MQRDGYEFVLTAPLTEIIDNPGFFIQMGMASMPGWLEGMFDKKYPHWKHIDRNEDGSCASAPAGLRVLEEMIEREFGRGSCIVAHPDEVDRFIGPATRAVGVSTHNPLGVTFAAGVYASIFGNSKNPINAIYALRLFERIRNNAYRKNFRVIVGGSGSWQISETNAFDQLRIDCVIDGRAESAETMNVFRRARYGEPLVRELKVSHPANPLALVIPEKRTAFGVIEMTTGCGRRCSFCLPDLNPQLSIPKDRIMKAVAANVAAGNSQISLATEDMFIWGFNGRRPFFFPNREVLLDLHQSIAEYPGVRWITLSHATIAPSVVDPMLIKQLSDMLLDKSPIRMRNVSTHPEGRTLNPLIGLETGSVRMARKIMAGKSLPFDVEHWPSVVIQGLTILNRNNWVPVMTLIIGSPDETDDDVKETLDLIFEMQRRGLKVILVPSVFTPLKETRMSGMVGIKETRQLSKLQWQLIMTCWRISANLALQSWWGPFAWSFGSFIFWLLRGRQLNGPNFTWPLLHFSRVLPDSVIYSVGELYAGKPPKILSHSELLDTVASKWKPYFADTAARETLEPVRA
ncbi:MAG: B12-binding domain-containing radical SAM protein [Acidobacteria bacterium]|nr:B12-binding domain-containing radical SAM protein [Acidobacteriota bacterium]